MDTMEIAVRDAGPDGSARVALSGALTIYTAADLRDGLLKAFDGHMGIELSAAGVSEIDTAGLQVLVSVVRLCAAEGRRLVCAQAGDAVMEAIDLLRLGDELGFSWPES